MTARRPARSRAAGSTSSPPGATSPTTPTRSRTDPPVSSSRRAVHATARRFCYVPLRFMTTRRLALSLAAFASLSGCGDDLPRQARDGGDVIDAAPLCIQLDAGPASACWPEELPDPSPEVRVEIGTGLIDFRPLPDAFEIACTDAQTGCYMAINARVSGIMPGDPKNPLCPSNPRTRAYVTLEETGELVGGNDRIRCVQRGYTATDTPGTYEMD